MSGKPTNNDRAQAVKSLPTGTVIRMGLGVGAFWHGEISTGGKAGKVCRSSMTPIGLVADLAVASREQETVTWPWRAESKRR